MEPYQNLREHVIAGQKDEVAALTQHLLDQGVAARTLLQEGLLPGMTVVGRKFQDGEFFIPEMLLAARALNAGLDLLKPLLEASDLQPVARVVLGTVKGDIHDIGKNLVAIMLRGGGFEVIDAGVDVAPDRFVALVRENQAEFVGLSALLTTTMPSMKETVDAFQAAGLRDQVKILIGGAPVTEAYAKKIGADGFARNAAAAVEVAKNLTGVTP